MFYNIKIEYKMHRQLNLITKKEIYLIIVESASRKRIIKQT